VTPNQSGFVRILRVCKLSLRAKLIYIEIADGVDVEPDDIGEVQRALLALCNEAQAEGILIVAQMPFLLSAAAREAAASVGDLPGIRATAIYSDLTSVRMIVNFFNRINRPRVPLRLFATQEAAEDWLLEQCKQA
jgi:hypothetical protein